MTFSVKKALLFGLLPVFAFIFSACSHSGDSNATSLIPTVYAETEDFTFQDYEETAFEEAEGPKAIFMASKACGSCAKHHKKMANEPDQFAGSVFRAEFDEASVDMKKEYNFKKWDAFALFDSKGEYVETVSGVSTDELNEKLKSLAS